ncbi:MAG: ester cyclase [Acidimicrobiales bacterium]
MADWAQAADGVVERGWAHLAGAVPVDLVQPLLEARRPEWHPLPEEEGVVRQQGFGSYLPLAQAEETVQRFAEESAQCLTDALSARDIPAFNEVTWTQYPSGRGHITAHREPRAYGGVIAVVTLEGAALFEVWDTGAPVSMEGFDLIRVRDGRCTEHWGVQDNAGMLQQLGVIPPP